jgi:sulfur carrier protein
MQITINGEARVCAPGTSVSTLLDTAGYAGKRVAVEVNLEIVPRSAHPTHLLAEGDKVEIVHAIGGG